MTKKDDPSAFRRKLLPSGSSVTASRMTVRALRMILSPARSDMQETFEEAAERLEWTEEDILGFERYRRKEINIFLAVLALAFLFACFSPYADTPWAHLVMALALMVMIGTRIMISHFRLTQVRDRVMYSFAEYWMILLPWLAVAAKEVSDEMRKNAKDKGPIRAEAPAADVPVEAPHARDAGEANPPEKAPEK